MEWFEIVMIVSACVAAVAAVAFAAACIAAASRRRRKEKAAERARFGSVEEIPREEIDETRLCEIGDVAVSDRVKALFPELVRAESSAGLAVTTASKTMYRVVLPAGTKMASGSAGGLMSAGVTAAAGAGVLVSGSVTAVMSAASMVVGQYYMTLVSRQLEKIAGSLSALGDFQDNEFRSRVFALNAQMGRTAMFREEIMANARTRNAEAAKTERLEHECISLLGQAALMIGSTAGKTDLDYAGYIGEVAVVEKWFVSQKILLQTLCGIADLRFALLLGAASREQCGALIPVYERQAEESQRRLTAWHEETAKRLGIHLEESKRRRKGLDRAVHWLPGLFKKDLRYRAIPASTVALIEEQISGKLTPRAEEGDLFGEDVEIISRDGKLYYLPPAPHGD